MNSLKIAIIGSRGIPAGYGGFETFAEELAPRLVDLGHDVTVYCRKGYTGETLLDEYKGVKLRYPGHIRQRELEQLSHEAMCILDSLRRRFDLYYFLGYRGSPMYVPVRLLTRRVVVVNTDGLEWNRRKWSTLARKYLKFAEWVAVRSAADHLVSDSQEIAKYFSETYGASSEFLTNGAYVLEHLPSGALDEWGLQPREYYLVACRIEPDNNVEIILREFVASGSHRELVIAGGMNYETPYWTKLQEIARGHRIRFLGPVYGDMRIENLHLGCYAYLHGHENGGTNPALLKGMGAGNCPIAYNGRFNREVTGGIGLLWEKTEGDLADKIRYADTHPDEVEALGRRAQERIRDHYTWEQVASDHDRFFRQVVRSRTVRKISPP
jgi:glycosyltransferase involved in cell wall biosynthesis